MSPIAKAFRTGIISVILAATAIAQPNFTVRHTAPGGGNVRDIVEGTSGMVAVGTNGTILHSIDGESWTAQPSLTSEWLVAIAFAEGRYVAVGAGGVILTSTDAKSWQLSPNSPTTQRLNNIAFGAGTWVAVGEQGTILWSNDAISWQVVANVTNKWLRALATSSVSDRSGKTHHVWIAGGETGTVLFSLNGRNWNLQSNFATSLAENIESFHLLDQGLGNSSGTPVHRHTIAAVGSNNFVYNLNAIFPLTATDAGPFEGHSSFFYPTGYPQGETGLFPTNASIDWRSIAGGNGTYVAVGSEGNIIASPQLSFGFSPWKKVDSNTSATLTGSGFGLNTLFVVGADQTILQSSPIFPGRLANLSTRGRVTQTSSGLIAGFVLDGGTDATLLLRAVGPRLADFMIASPLLTPRLRLFDGNAKVLAQNSTWVPSNALSIAERTTGAFPYNTDSADSALLTTLSRGAYTVVIDSVENDGVALAEVYDTNIAQTVTVSRPVNLSTRGRVGSGEDVLIGGFSVKGSSAMRLLIRGIGPTLDSFGVENTLSNPAIKIISVGGTTLASNNDWETQTISGDPNTTPDRIVAAAAKVGAFPLTTGSLDAALVIELVPGNYTVIVSGENNSPGEALFEVYALP